MNPNPNLFTRDLLLKDLSGEVSILEISGANSVLNFGADSVLIFVLVLVEGVFLGILYWVINLGYMWFGSHR